MKKEKSHKLEEIKYDIFEKITSYLDYHSIYELYHSSKNISKKLEEVGIINTLDLRQMNIEENQIEQIFKKSRFKYDKIRLEFKDIGENIIDLFPNNLKEINLNGCHRIKDEGILKLIPKIHHLKILELYWMPQLTDKSVSVIIKNCPNLIVLNLSGCKNLTDRSLEDINSDCPMIQHIDLTRCSGLTVNTFSNVCKLKNLNYLNLYALANLNCDFLSSLSANNICKLEFFDLCGNLNINDVHIKQCINAFKHLKYLNLSWCVSLKDEGLRLLIPELYQLELLSLHGILGITDETVNLMKTNGKLRNSLTTLDLYGCANIKQKDKDYLRSIFKFVKVFKHHT